MARLGGRAGRQKCIENPQEIEIEIRKIHWINSKYMINRFSLYHSFGKDTGIGFEKAFRRKPDPIRGATIRSRQRARCVSRGACFETSYSWIGRA
jgi:hypothetical protein